ncbi:MAG: hypothetical protein ACRDQ2_15125, partial [Gaiellales bacterium]
MLTLGTQHQQELRPHPRRVRHSAALISAGEVEAGVDDVGHHEEGGPGDERPQRRGTGRTRVAEEDEADPEEQQQVADRIGREKRRGQRLLTAANGRPDDEIPDDHRAAQDHGGRVQDQPSPLRRGAGGRTKRQEAPQQEGVEREVSGIGERRERLAPPHDLEVEPQNLARPPAQVGDGDATPG